MAQFVDGVSERDKSQPWEQRKRESLARLESASEEVLLLSCADKLDNIRSIRRGLIQKGEALWVLFNRPKSAQSWFYRQASTRLSQRLQGEPGARLAAALAQEVSLVFD